MSMEQDTDKQHKKQYSWLEEYQWKPGKTGNKKGRPKGKTMKEWAKLFLMELPDAEKLDFLKGLAPDIVWKMAEGNPHNTSDEKHEHNVLVEISEKIAKKRDIKKTN